MSGAAALLSLVKGEASAGALLLPSVRASGWGTEAFAEESVLSLFRAGGSDVNPLSSTIIEDATGAAVASSDQAVVADVIEGRLHRIWRLGPGSARAQERAIRIPFDPDLKQLRGGIVGAAEWGEDEALVRSAGEQVQAVLQAYRLRLFPVRVIGTGKDRLLLFAAHLMVGEQQRQLGFVLVAVAFEGGRFRVIRDLAGEEALFANPHPPRI